MIGVRSSREQRGDSAIRHAPAMTKSHGAVFLGPRLRGDDALGFSGGYAGRIHK